VSAAIILCDRVYTSTQGQHVIAGTHTNLTVRLPPTETRARHRFHRGLNLYLRFQPVRSGETGVAVKLKDERREVWGEHWLATSMRITVPDPAPRLVEMAVTTPKFAVDIAWSQPGSDRLVLRNTIELEVDGNLLATTPFDVIFQRGEPAGPDLA
jgi:hypothetical protein